ncbi:hypothetical protein [Sphingomicrobium sediminis]|uniref:Uncharacterized protein n=1 Tax=Sphingomicrobium sediminis TaxID=2950949 RepID=A0A9X2EGY9_9SPHN|nr:hypothetical protein [Sphingomicrobium sediminis]MCM8557330.1 hypothetical protein [Sphingomicrobium sediminis]
MITLKPLKPYKKPRGIKARWQSVRSDEFKCDWAIGVVSFHGKVPDGSRGREHADYIALECLHGMARMEAIALVMDMRALIYRWGNSIGKVFDVLRRHYHYEWEEVGKIVPIRMVTSDKSAGFQSLVDGDGFLCDSVEEAVRECAEEVAVWAAD